MPKKPRSQRRKKGTTPSSANDDDDENDRALDDDVEQLSDDHTVGFESMASSSVFGDYDADGDIDDGDADATAAASAADPETISRQAAAAATRQSRLLDALSAASTVSTERRAAKREACLRKLFKAVTQYAAGSPGRDAVRSRLDDVLAACATGLRSGTPAEQYAACRVMEATSVVLGGDNDDYCDAVDDHLRRAVKATGKAAQVRGAALRALSMSYFICSTDPTGTNAILDLCEAVCAPAYRGEAVPPCLRAIALDCWALLSTTVHDAYIAGDDWDGSGGSGRGVVILPLLQQCLDHANVELRSAGGECFALIHESRLNLGVNEDEGENTTERRFRQGSWDGSEWEVLMDEVKQRVAELSVESGHHMSKKAKKEQRQTFREFMATIVDDEAPTEVVTFRGGNLTLSSWREIIQLNFIRHCLQGGFQIQLMTNPTLHAIFGANGNLLIDASAASMSQLEKRLTMSKASEASKAADIDMTRKRRNRTNVKNYFITADGEDI